MSCVFKTEDNPLNSYFDQTEKKNPLPLLLA